MDHEGASGRFRPVPSSGRPPVGGRERVLVAVPGDGDSEKLIRRAARRASRAAAELHVVHVETRRGPAEPSDRLDRLRALTDHLDGTHHTVEGDDPAEAVLQLARGLQAFEIVVGTPTRPRWRRLFRSSVSERIASSAGAVDVIVVTHESPGRRRGPRGRETPLGRGRLLAGWLLAVIGPWALPVLLVPASTDLTLALEAMSYLALAVACALVGGRWPALVAAVLSSLALNWFFTPPERTLTVADPVHLATLLMFLVVAAAVASVVDKAARRSVQAELARREADMLMALSRSLLHAEQDVTAVLTLLRQAFALDAVALLRRGDVAWQSVAAVGESPPARPDEADTTTDVAPGLLLAVRGSGLEPHKFRGLRAFATHIAVVLKRQELTRRAEAATALEQGNRVRTALLAAVSHDLRTPLAGIKAAVSSLRSPDVTWSPNEEAELLGAIEDATDHLHVIIANLLDLSRLQTEAVHSIVDRIWIDDVVSQTIAALSGGDRVDLRFSPDLPPVVADAGLLDRVVSNLVDNALKHSPVGTPVTVSTSSAAGRVQLRVVDHGAGVPESDRDRMFEAFQRLGDTTSRDGLGLGLAVARGLTEAQGGLLRAEDTPGGGLTMVVDLPAASSAGLDPAAMAHR
jgi:two-component system sensor histidine kinase KdpD